MHAPQKPPDETARLAALRRLAILDTPSEERFDRITRIAQRLFDVPIAIVSLVDEDRQWFKSCQGLDVTETSRDVSFCGHAILDNHVFVIEDARQDERFHDNPLVTGGPRIRFYAGAPLATVDGLRLGMLCIISPKPRDFDEGARACLRDLSEIVRQELIMSDLSRARDAAVEASRAKSQFLAGLSHEIRTPLNVVIGMSELLEENQLNGEQRDRIETIRASANALLALINDILDLSKIEASQLELECTAFQPENVVQAALRLIQPSARAKRLRLDHSSPGLDTWTLGDPNRLRQVLLNLLNNAVKFTRRGHVRLELSVLEQTPDHVQLRLLVEDTGIGVFPEHVAKVFSAFQQADTSITRRFGGTGLGLTISQRIVTAMGGQIQLESLPGKGTRFWFDVTLPVTDPPAAVFETVDGDVADRRILVVEDFAPNRKVILAQLAKLGCQVDAVDSGSAAFKKLAHEAYDVVLMDVQMPGWDGLETTRRLRAEPFGRSVPIIALTANAFAEDRRDCLEAGMDDFISKPVRLSELREALGRNLRPPEAPPSSRSPA